MIIKTLVENTALNDTFRANHGLSFYIETQQHKILFDVGKNENIVYNAKQLDVHLDQVDTVVISHAHLDHGGALDIFLENNSTATIYLQKSAFEKYYAVTGNTKQEIGLNRALKTHPQVRLVDGFIRLDAELSLFSKILGRKLTSPLNACLCKQTQQEIVPDDFEHEQCLVVESEGKKLLFGGCAHNGIVNILERVEDICKTQFDFVFSGFHLFDPITKTPESPELVAAIAQELLRRKTVFYTGHCTGQEVFARLKKLMGKKIEYASAGSQIFV